MTYAELRYTLAMFNRWRSKNADKYEKISNYLGTHGKCLSLFEFHTNNIIKQYREPNWEEVYKMVSRAMESALKAFEMLDQIGAVDTIKSIVESIPLV